jgi:transcriptional regulator with XRE-family HTH domain
MVSPRELDPSSSALAFFGSELRRYRTGAGLSQDRLGEVINYTGSLVGLVETARRSPSQEFAERCDAALGTGGALRRLWPLVNREAFPEWFRAFVEMEAAATRIFTFQSQVVPGLLQTERYAYAVLDANRPADTWEELSRRVDARLGRQQIFAGPNPPMLWAVLDESVLRRPVGGPDVMAEQLTRLAEVGRKRWATLQILPLRVGAHASLDGPFALLSLIEGEDVVHIEGGGTGYLTAAKSAVEKAALSYDFLRADALSQEDSLALITSVAEEMRGDRSHRLA